MKPRRISMVAAVVALVAASFMALPSAFAHTEVSTVLWDDPANPTRVIGRTGGIPISSTPGQFSLKVFNSAGAQVDNGDPVVAPSFTELSVGVPAGLNDGVYTVQWSVVGEDGHPVSGARDLQLDRGRTAPPQLATPAAGGHSHGSDAGSGHGSDTGSGHSHGAPTHAPEAAHEDEGHSHRPTEPFTLELNLTGAGEVPAVQSAASAFARLTIDPATNEVVYAFWVSGVAADAVTGLHLHRGAAGENGPHIYDIINDGFTTVSGSFTLTAADMEDLYAGNTYLRLHTQDHPQGAARVQVVVPVAEHSHDDEPSHDHGTIRPPSTGDAGLVDAGVSAGTTAAMIAAVLLALTGAGAGFVLIRR